ncbi:MAG: carbohydrate ABC transporter permease [Bacillota bacterium]
MGALPVKAKAGTANTCSSGPANGVAVHADTSTSMRAGIEMGTDPDVRLGAGAGLPGRRLQRPRLRSVASAVVSHAVLIAGALVMVVPFIWMLSTSLKPTGDVLGYSLDLIPRPPMWDNYVKVWQSLPFARYFWNSLVVSSTVTLLQLATCSMAAYAFARLRFPGRDTLFLLYLGTLMIPGQVTMIPNFILVRLLGWQDTYMALILPEAFSAFGTFLLRQFFLTIPAELEDAAKIDGCSWSRVYASVILPLAKPALAALAIFTFMGQWNNFLWPFIVTSSEQMKTLTVGLRSFQGMYYTDWNLLMAGSLISLVPILVVFFLAQEHFIKGIALTGMGGR